MRTSVILIALALCGCKTTQSGPEAATVSQVVERKVPVIVPCEATVAPFSSGAATQPTSVEEKLDSLVSEALALNKYTIDLQMALVQCGGKIQ